MISHRNSRSQPAAHPKEPNKKSLDKFLRGCATKIERLQREMDELRAEINKTNSGLKSMREEKDDCFKEKDEVEARILARNVDINSATDEQSKLRSNLSYRDEQRLDDTIRRLQNTSQTVRSQSEKKKIEDEIQILTRSKKVTIAYREITERITELRAAQKHDRDARDRCVKRKGELRRAEDTEKRIVGELRRRREDFQTEMDELVQSKRDRRADFTRCQVEYQTLLEKEKELAREKRQAEREEILPAEPNQEERKLCLLLHNFLEGQLAAEDKKSRRKGNKRLRMNPVTLNQFLSLDIQPPMNIDHIPAALESLSARHREFSTVEETPQAPDSPTNTDSGESVASVPPSRSISQTDEAPIICPSGPVPSGDAPIFIGVNELIVESWLEEKVSFVEAIGCECEDTILALS